MPHEEPVQGIIPRRVQAITTSRLAEEPVIALQGPRAVGKSTLLRQVATAAGVGVIDLDDLAIRDAVRADPGPFVAGPSPVCIDEYQHAPIVLDAIKAELNRDLREGRYLLTGSTRYGALPKAAQSLTGRLHVVQIWPLSQGEIEGVHENLLEVLLADPAAAGRADPSILEKPDYIRRIARGGFPIAIARRTETTRSRWIDDYERLVLERDIPDLANVRAGERLPAFLRRLASQTGQVLNLSASARAAGIDRESAAAYLALFESVFLVLRLSAWGKTLRSRVSGKPKIHLVDAGIATRLLRITPDKLARLDASSLSEFGHLLESFVVMELLKQASWLEGIAGVGHWRTHDGDEVDLVIERDDGGIVAFEVKAGSRVSSDDLRGLRKLREAAGEAFLAGVALHTGIHSYPAEDRLTVMPIDRIWEPN